MKSMVLRAFSFFTLAFFITIPTLRAADTNPPPRLTVELRDGSRVVGTSAEKNFKFHSALLGDFKLDVKDIRSIDSVNTNSAKLTTAKGDELTVSFLDPDFAVKTSFGKVKMQVDTVRKLSVVATKNRTPTHSGMVSLWSAEGNCDDSVGGNNGTLTGNTSFEVGQVGQAFLFHGNKDLVKVGNPPCLQLQEFTIEAWVKRTDNSFVSHGSEGYGIIFGYGFGGYGLCLDSTGRPVLTKVSAGGTRPAMAISDTNFHHLAVTKYGNTVIFHVDGIAYPAPAYDPGFDFSTVAAIGARGDNLDNSFIGLIDEVAIYNRALTASEILEDYEAGHAK